MNAAGASAATGVPGAAVLVAAGVLAAAACVRAAGRAGRSARVGGRLAAGARAPGGRGRRTSPWPGAPGWFRVRLAATGAEWPPEAAWAAAVAAPPLALVAGWVLAGPGLGLLGAAAAVGAPGLAWVMWRHRGDALLEAALPAALDAVARGLRSGASLRQAVAEAAAATSGVLGADLARVAAAAERGAGLVAALERWGAERPLAGVRLVVSALCLGAETGGAQARAVDGVAATLRQRAAAAAEAQALASQARLSALVIVAAPVAFCALVSTVDAASARFLLRTPVGLALLAAGLALDAAAALWMSRLTRVVS